MADETRVPPVVAGRYVVRELIGAGAFGTVYRAEHRVLDVPLRSVALKRFGSGDATPAMLREALKIERLVGGCDDPVVRHRLVGCLDAGVDEDGVPFLVMELAEGSLADRVVRDRGWPAATVRSWLREICQGVGFLHRQGAVHLDLKPANVLRTASGSLKIGDFGHAERINDLLRSAPMGGTLTHQAPEILGGGVVDARADVYAIGMIGYQLLTGRLPHHHEVTAALPQEGPADVGALRRIRTRPVPPPGELVPSIRNEPLEELVVRALSPNSADRPDDATVLLELLDRAEPAAPAVSDRERVRAHVGLLEQALRTGDLAHAERLAIEAGALDDALPAPERVVELYPLLVDLALRRDEVGRARAVAKQGLAVASCPATWRAAARAFAGTPAGEGFLTMLRAREGRA
ncbi:MAG TPA: serine/threonine-protein kinase [Pseudonocardia sp.]|uniref:serine/threonine-protein kinase n=1 Tax=Pseudonocardia sp. TaxID=60912 RepID=UPI002B4B2B75|nr:serine/threonine-protein kinase [Pseudonocardia sp.]HLU60195.1 serine/threonine-protein kinase [Pseudonocardia sp.]